MILNKYHYVTFLSLWFESVFEGVTLVKLMTSLSFSKVDDNDASKSASSGRGKKPVMKMVMEYCYEPEMEEVIIAFSSF